MTNEKGELMANVHENPAFREVWDYHGTEKMRFRLERKKDAVFSRYSAKTQLFQKVYYAKGLLLADE